MVRAARGLAPTSSNRRPTRSALRSTCTTSTTIVAMMTSTGMPSQRESENSERESTTCPP